VVDFEFIPFGRQGLDPNRRKRKVIKLVANYVVFAVVLIVYGAQV